MIKPDAGVVVRRIRLITGLVLFAYVTMHLVNHAFGLVSLEAMEAGRLRFLALWRNPVGTVVLYGSLVTHMLLAFWSLYRRRRLRMPGWEATQLLLGLAIPPLLVEHILGTRMAFERYDTIDTYRYVTLVLWEFLPEKGYQQMVTLVVAWLHGCVGLHFWLRLKSGYGRLVPLAYAGALLVPVLALLGFVATGREVSALASDPAWLARTIAALNFPDEAAVRALGETRDALLIGFAALLALTLLARLLRDRWERRRGIVRLSYPGNRVVEITGETTVLDASRGAGIAHASICGGRGRCSTCRIRLGRGADRVSPPSPAESRVLERVGAAPNVRLACQLRPTADLEVTPLVPPTATPRAARARPAHLSGEEREIAILFADLRAFTRFAEQKLPYDVVFVLNRYFESMGQAIESAGGHVDKFIGDGVMALFGIDGTAAAGCRQSLAAARAMALALAELNRALADDLEAPLRIGIGIHAGPAIVGEMGYARATSVTAVGDSVNTASRLETMTKEFSAQLVVSEAVAERAGADLSRFDRHDVAIRGRREPLGVRVVGDARELPDAAAADVSG